MKKTYTYEVEIKDEKFGWRGITFGGADTLEEANRKGQEGVDYYISECGYESRFKVEEICATCSGTKKVKGRKFMQMVSCPDCTEVSKRTRKLSSNRNQVRRDLGLKHTKYGWE